MIFTLFDGEVSHCQGHGVPWEYVVSTVDMIAIDAQAAAGGDGDDPLDVLCRTGLELTLPATPHVLLT